MRKTNHNRFHATPIMRVRRDREAEAELSVEQFLPATVAEAEAILQFEQECVDSFGCFPLKDYSNRYYQPNHRKLND